MAVFRSTAAQLLVSDRRLQLALLLQPVATGAVAEMGEVAGGVDVAVAAEDGLLLPVRKTVDLKRRGTALPVLWSGEMRLFVVGKVGGCSVLGEGRIRGTGDGGFFFLLGEEKGRATMAARGRRKIQRERGGRFLGLEDEREMLGPGGRSKGRSGLLLFFFLGSGGWGRKK